MMCLNVGYFEGKELRLTNTRIRGWTILLAHLLRDILSKNSDAIPKLLDDFGTCYGEYKSFHY